MDTLVFLPLHSQESSQELMVKIGDNLTTIISFPASTNCSVLNGEDRCDFLNASYSNMRAFHSHLLSIFLYAPNPQGDLMYLCYDLLKMLLDSPSYHVLKPKHKNLLEIITLHCKTSTNAHLIITYTQ